MGLGGGASGSLFAYEGRAFVPLPGRPASFQTGNGKRFQAVPAAVRADHPTGGWNDVEVTCNKLVWLVKVNGRTVNQADATEIEPWVPCLHAFPGFEIRNMRIRDLSR